MVHLARGWGGRDLNGPEFLKGLPPSLMSRSCLCYIHSLKLTANPSCPFHPSSTEVISYCLVMWRLHLGFVVESRQRELFCWNDSKPTHEPGHIFSYCASKGECPDSCFSCSSPFGTSRLESCLPYDSRLFLSQGAPTASSFSYLILLLQTPFLYWSKYKNILPFNICFSSFW